VRRAAQQYPEAGRLSVIRQVLASASVILTLTTASAGPAQDISIVSVLRMATEEAETAPDEAQRARLRAIVTLHIRRAGNEAAFPGHAFDPRAVQGRRERPKADADEVDKFNFELEERAERAFLAGDPEGAEQILRACRVAKPFPPPSCSQGEFPLPREVWRDLKFILWDFTAGRHDAVIRRLRTAAWPAEYWQMVLVMFGPMLAGDNSESRIEIQRLTRLSGVEVESCIVKASSFLLYSMFGGKPPTRLEEAAVLRQMACTGKAQGAIDMARAQTSVSRRITALGVVAEGLAQVPGLPDEKLGP
jgi:hypothetical protein